ncbi:MAG TPA: hypothetical protein VMW38_17015 [Terriglobia bacterium]|nr:hypothetical protein [Terriglobia bacterium]
MEISHLSAIAIFSLSVSIVFSLTTKETVKERLRYAAFVFFCFIGVAVAVGWAMYFFPR